MKPLYSTKEYEHSTLNTKLLCECYNCHEPFAVTKLIINRALSNYRNRNHAMFCSQKCLGDIRKNIIIIQCKNCNKEFKNKNKSQKKNVFCSRSCSATFNNKNKTHGNRRSKLEKYIEEQLTQQYPKLKIHFNKKNAINSELDIYIPSLNIAFELNGPLHYKPIYGEEKLSQIKNNDKTKLLSCIENKISLHIIDTSNFGYFKIIGANKFFEIIIQKIEEKLSGRMDSNH